MWLGDLGRRLGVGRQVDRVNRWWSILRPPQLVLEGYAPGGTRFEVSTLTERSRIVSVGSEPEFLRRTLEEVGPSDIFYDIGGCLGLFSIPAAQKGAHVFAFEPDPGYRRRLKRNAALNRVRRRIRVIDWAVSDRRGRATLYTDGVDGRSPSLAKEGDRGAVVVRTDTIDRALARGDLPRPTVVKMDIEGAEVLAIRGMAGVLGSAEGPRCLFLEVHPALLAKLGSSESEVNRLLAGCGYVEQTREERGEQVHAVWRKVCANG